MEVFFLEVVLDQLKPMLRRVFIGFRCVLGIRSAAALLQI
jgi:hypothetical protein